MTNIEVTAKDIGGVENTNANLKIGQMNIIEGSSSSGKSSLMRGIHLALVGRPPMEKVYEEEAETLHLDDRTSDQALLRRGSSEGSVSVKTPATTFSASLPANGMIKGQNSSPKALFTTMLSALPPSRIHRAVFNASSDNPNDFKWVVDDLSEAGNYQTWHSVLNAVDQEVGTMRLKFNSWKDSLSGADARRKEIRTELDAIQKRSTARSEGKGAAEAALGEKTNAARNKKSKSKNEFERLDGEYRQSEALNSNHKRRIDAAKTQRKTAQRKLDEAEDLLEMDFSEPDTSALDAAIGSAQSKVEAASGESAVSGLKEAVDAFLAEKDKISAASSKFASLFGKVIEGLGDESKLKQAMIELKEAKSRRDSIVRTYLDKKRQFGMADQQAAAARAEINSAKATIEAAKKDMTKDSSSLPMKKEKRDQYETAYKAASAELEKLLSQSDTSDPEDVKDRKAERALTDELSTLENTTTFAIRFTSLNMLANQTMNLTLKEAELMLGMGASKEANKDLIQNNLSKGAGEIRSILTAELDRGLLGHIGSSAQWAAEEADRQRQETRRVFNNVGTTMFKRLKVSPITGVSLNIDYNIEINWADGPPTGLSGAGGERTIIAAALLIAMRKAYTPEIPILMLDGVMENLDDRPREELLAFLGEYAKTEDIAVLTSRLNRQYDSAKVISV
jgi:energy-coupling factor transporter ATP-binding protein EcfA2